MKVQTPPEEQVRVLPPNFLPEGTRLGRWQVVEQLATGGFGVVYAVRRHGRPRGRLYALKLALQPGEK
jgi:hypothetical protein